MIQARTLHESNHNFPVDTDIFLVDAAAMMDAVQTEVVPRLRYYPVARRIVSSAGTTQLQRREGDLLAMLLRAGVQAVAFEDINAALWPRSSDEHANASRRHLVKRLREKLADNGLPIEIEVIRGCALLCTSDVEIVD